MKTSINLLRKAAAPIVASGLAMTALPASAMTAQPIPNAVEAPTVTLISGGCGLRFHRTVYGTCRPNFVRFGYRYGYPGFGFRGPGIGIRIGGFGYRGGYRGFYGYHRGYRGWRRHW